MRHSDEELARPAERRASDDAADHGHQHIEALDREPLLPQVGALQKVLESLHFGQNAQQVHLTVPIHRIRVHSHLDVIDEPIPLDRVLHVVQLVADPAGVDAAEAFDRIACRAAQGLETDGGRGDSLEILPRDSVELGIDGWVARAGGAERIDLYVEVPMRTQ